MANAKEVQSGPPRVFISYTHESKAHKEWVGTLATALRQNGIDAVLDQWELSYGDDVTLFMENGIRSAARVLLVCTPTYATKANEGTGGVGYERLVVTGEMAENIDTNKFICVLRDGDKSISLPSFAKSRLFIDFRDDANYPLALQDLLRDFHQARANPKPPIGANPFETSTIVSAQPRPEEGQLRPDSDPEKLFAKAESLLRQKDLMGWKRLVREVRKDVAPALRAWRAKYDGLLAKTSVLDAMREAVGMASPLFLLALTAVDSEIDQLRDQKGLLGSV